MYIYRCRGFLGIDYSYFIEMIPTPTPPKKNVYSSEFRKLLKQTCFPLIFVSFTKFSKLNTSVKIGNIQGI